MLKRYIKKLEKQQQEEEENNNNNNSSSDQKNKNENEISLMLQSIQLSSSSSITTRDMMGRSSTNNDFLNQISNEIHFVLCEHYLFQSNESNSDSTNIIIAEESRRRWKMISLSDLFCILNVWRGTDLLSPLDVKQSIQILCSSSSSSQVSKSYTIPSSNKKVQIGYEIRYFSSCTTLLIFQKTFNDDNQENENERKLKEEGGEDGLQFGSGISKRGNDNQNHQGGGIDEIIKYQILNFVLCSYFGESKKKKMKGVSLEEIASYLKVSPLICQELVSWVEENHQYQFEFEEEEEMGDLIEEDEEELTIWLKNKALKKGNIVRDEDEWGTILYFPNLYF